MRDTDATRFANTWKRVGTVEAGSAVWELSTLAVDPDIQKQGLSRYLMEMVEGEAKRQFKTENDELQRKGEPLLGRLMMIIVTIKQKNFDLYSRRGFVQDYETSYPAGYMVCCSRFMLHELTDVPTGKRRRLHGGQHVQGTRSVVKLALTPGLKTLVIKSTEATKG